MGGRGAGGRTGKPWKSYTCFCFDTSILNSVGRFPLDNLCKPFYILLVNQHLHSKAWDFSVSHSLTSECPIESVRAGL